MVNIKFVIVKSQNNIKFVIVNIKFVIVRAYCLFVKYCFLICYE